MDERLKKALDHSNYMITLNNQKRVLLEQYQNDLMCYFNGGQFSVKPELVSFCQSLLHLKQTESVLVDDNGLPIEIDSLEDFTKKITNIYFTASNKYLTEYNKLKKNRTVEGIVSQ
jgi:conjugal transfer/entry exclusion protein